MVNCPHPYELQDFVDGELSPEIQSRVTLHLQNCESCTARVNELCELQALLISHRVSAPAGFLEKMLDLLRTALPVRKLSCSEALELTGAYVDNELNELECETLEAHLFACEDCYREYVALRTATQALREQPRVEVAADLKDRILAAILADENVDDSSIITLPVKHAAFSWRRAFVPAIAAAALFMLSFGAFKAIHNSPAQESAQIAALPEATTTQEPVNTQQPVQNSNTTQAQTMPADSSSNSPVATDNNVPVPDSSVKPEISVYPAPDSTDIAMGTRSGAQTVRVNGAQSGKIASSPSVKPGRTTASRTTTVQPQPTPTGPRRYTVIEPPKIASTGGHDGVVSSERSVKPSGSRIAIVPDSRTSAPISAYVGSTGVVTHKPISGGSRPVELTRPAPRPVAPHVAARPAEVKPSPAVESTRVASRSWVPRVSSERVTIYEGVNSGDSGLRDRVGNINAQAAEEKRLKDSGILGM